MVVAGDPVAVPETGYFYYGRPQWLTDDLLAALCAEAAAERAKAVLLRRQFHTPTGPIASALADSPELHALIESDACPVTPARRANYLYYEAEGQGIDPHTDDHDFQINVLMTLEHRHTRWQRSTLVLFPHGPDDPLRIHQRPGELVLFWAAAVVHARTNVTQDERVTNLGIGYRPR
ncbi:hypothetical protein V5P93_005056 [Actinokineospora auranticolor]|uniref:2-oxoglutarate-Fe(II)-dependent oxygenase superfamily protein n=1 Tax=Actinokineospora auranticolor TaxID=155976 RepID=A0A2S6GK18_9PSEU|nr:hypothetical protein [Actinokineospora auranticolor]PPK65584.1 2-oxoglutarate-Fe(II)-dependent oxygenase superfamily protein [Actinokineospora auranticolor]